MKPLNNDNNGCSPISSNCVIWQGPDIPCIKLCKGDSVSDTVYKLATELCEVLTVLDINTYDITCLVSTGCAPEDFQGLMQLIISKICGPTSSTGGGSNPLDPIENQKIVGGSVDTVVPIAECFVYVNEFGDRVTTMTLSLYVRTIGNKICDLVNQINAMNMAIANLDNRVTTLENTPVPTFALASLTPVCVLPPNRTDIYSIISATEQQFCDLRAALGLPNNIYDAITKQCVGLSGSSAMGPSGGNMGSIPGWFSTVQNLAQSYTNLWLTVCDLRAAVQNIKLNCCPTGCDGISIMMTSQMTGTNLTIFLTGTIPVGFNDCNPSGSLFTITDTTGGIYSIRISVVSQINAIGGTIVPLLSTPINIASDIAVDADICLTDGTSTCQFCVDYVAKSMSSCPSLTVTTATDTSLDYTYNVVFVPGTYTVELWNSAGTAVIAATTTVVAIAGPISGSFTGLVASTTYKIRVVTDIGGNITQCAFANVTTTPVVCNPPTGVTAAFVVPIACPTCGDGLTIVGFASSPSTDGWYIDDDSDTLRLYESGSFNDFFRVMPDLNVIPPTVGPITSIYDMAMCYINDPTSTHGYHGFHVITSFPNGGPAGGSSLIFIQNTTVVTTVPIPVTVTPIRALCYDSTNGGRLCLTTNLGFAYLDLATLTFTAYTATLSTLHLYFNPFNNKKYAMAGNGGSGTIWKVMDTADNVTTIISVGSPGFPASTFGSTGAVNPNTGEVWITIGCGTAVGASTVYVIDPVTDLITNTIPLLGTNVPIGTQHTNQIMCYCPLDNHMYLGVQDVNCPAIPANLYVIRINAGTKVVDPVPFITTPVLFTSLTYSTVFNKFITQGNDGINRTYDINGNVISQIPASASQVFYVIEDPVYEHIIYFRSAIASLGYLELDTDNVTSCVGISLVNFYDNADTTGPYEFDTVSNSWLPYVTYSSMVDNGNGTVTITAILINNAEATMMYSQNGGLSWTNSGGFITAADWALGQTFTIAQPFLFQLAILTPNACGLSGPTNDTFN